VSAHRWTEKVKLSLDLILLLLYSVFVKYLILKGKVRPTTGPEGPEGEYRYSSTLSLTSG
jgi:hypothetical protein